MDIIDTISERKFQKMLEATPDAMIIVNKNGNVDFINAQTEKLFGYEKDELIGQPVEMLIPEPYRRLHTSHRNSYNQKPNARPMGTGMPLFARRKNSEIFPVEISLSPLETREGLFILASIRDITERKKAEEKEKELNKQLVTLSRQAGMSEVASFVLHNIGNILNSVNTSVSLIKELVGNREIKTLNKICKTIKKNVHKNPDFLLSDSKGKLIPDFLHFFSENLIEEHKKIDKEICNLMENVNHIKNIVHMQKDISGVSGIREKIHLPEVVDLSVQMCFHPSKENHIFFIKKYEYTSHIITNKSKLLQILVNLIKNANDAVFLQKNHSKRKIILSTIRDDTSIKIIVQDNGVGIPKKELTKVFSMGYTTKKGGHGYGLHSSALAANELGGSLFVESKGVGKGASFILTLPLDAGDSVKGDRAHEQS